MKNALSFDLEDWFCVSNLSLAINKDDWDKCELRVVQNTRRILTLLDDYNTKATFFVLGWIADRVPELVREIDWRGHEIATHGYSHTMLTEMTPESFEEDLLRALHVTKKCTKQRILGFRAPSFTITNSTMWALDILAKHGIRYDSSIFPIGFHPDYGFSAAPLSIYKHNDCITEFPIAADYELILRFLYKHRISTIYLPKILLTIRTGGVSRAGFFNTSKMFIDNYKACKSNGLKPALAACFLKRLLKIPQYIIKP